jgi:hypothetical protein
VEHYKLIENDELKQTLSNLKMIQPAKLGKVGDITPIIDYIKKIQ